MSASTALSVAQALLAVHIAAAAFIIAGMAAIPLGVHYGWIFVYSLWGRLLHIAALAVVVIQRLLGQKCFLSVWEEHFLKIARHGTYAVPLIHSVGDRVIHVPLPFAATTWVYSAGLMLLLYWWYRWPPALRLQHRR